MAKNGSDRKRLSKFLSFVLRHCPESAALTLDERGFCAIADLLAAAGRKLGRPVSRAEVEALAVPSDDPAQKTRFEIEGNFVRAGHGHTIEVGGYRPTRPRSNLFHATPRGSLASIRKEGLRSMRRQKVHLSYDRAITIEAARRRSRDTVLVEVDVALAMTAGVGFFESADGRIVLSEDVPPSCLTFHVDE